MNIRPEIETFARMMEEKMASKDEERDDSWKAEDLKFFHDRLRDEMHELERVLEPYNLMDRREPVLSECLDIANFAMMMAYFATSAFREVEFDARP